MGIDLQVIVARCTSGNVGNLVAGAVATKGLVIDADADANAALLADLENKEIMSYKDRQINRIQKDLPIVIAPSESSASIHSVRYSI